MRLLPSAWLLAMTLIVAVPVTATAQVRYQLSDPVPQTRPASMPIQSSIGDLETELEPEWEDEEEESPYDEPIETDRHDFTQSPKVVGCGVLQLEYGFFYAFKEEGSERERTYATPELLIRYGLSDRLEIRSRWNYSWKQFNNEENIDGLDDVRMSLKYEVSEACYFRPETALELRLTAPLGGDEITTNRWEPGIDYIYQWELSDYFTLAGSTGANASGLGETSFAEPNRNIEDEFVAWTQSCALGAKLTRRVTGYAEWYGIYTDGREEDVSLSFVNLGVDYLINNNCVLDLRIGWGISEDADDLFAGAGGAVRF